MRTLRQFARSIWIFSSSRQTFKCPAFFLKEPQKETNILKIKHVTFKETCKMRVEGEGGLKIKERELVGFGWSFHATQETKTSLIKSFSSEKCTFVDELYFVITGVVSSVMSSCKPSS